MISFTIPSGSMTILAVMAVMLSEGGLASMIPPGDRSGQYNI